MENDQPDMTMTVRSVRGYLSLGNITVPSFQRDYEWTKREVQDLLADIAPVIHGKVPRHNLNGVATVRDHETGKRILLDGQQRTTTLTILLSVIRDLYIYPFANPVIQSEQWDRHPMSEVAKIISSTEGALLEMRETDARVFQTLIFPRFDATTRKQWNDVTANTSKNLRNTYFLLVDFVGNYVFAGDPEGKPFKSKTWAQKAGLNQQELNVDAHTWSTKSGLDFSVEGEPWQRLENLTASVLDQITVHHNHSDVMSANEMLVHFETSNNRGRALAISERMKTSLYRQALSETGGSMGHADEMVLRWDRLMESLRTQPRAGINKFIEYWINGTERKSSSAEERLDVMQSWIVGIQTSRAVVDPRFANVNEFINEAERLGEALITVATDPILQANGSHVSHSVLLMQACGQYSKKEYEEIRSLVIALSFWSRFKSDLPQKTKDMFGTLAREVAINRVSASEIIAKLQVEVPNRSEAETLVPAVAKMHFKPAQARLLLGAYEATQRGAYGSELVALNQLHVEHIAPINPSSTIKNGESVSRRDHWMAAVDAKENNTYRQTAGLIGNLALLEGSINVSIQDAPWDVKRAAYLGESEDDENALFSQDGETVTTSATATRMYLTKEVALTDVWDFQAIQERSEEMAEKIVLLFSREQVHQLRMPVTSGV